MPTFSIFDPATGRLTGARVRLEPASAAVLARMTPPGMAAIEGEHNHEAAIVDLSTVDDFGAVVPQVVPWRAPAPAADEWHTRAWDEAAQTWVAVPTEAALWREVRAERDRRLTATDWRVARAAEAGGPVPQAWRDYRQALRDITQQADPAAIAWPQEPAA